MIFPNFGYQANQGNSHNASSQRLRIAEYYYLTPCQKRAKNKIYPIGFQAFNDVYHNFHEYGILSSFWKHCQVFFGFVLFFFNLRSLPPKGSGNKFE